jgi:hypothetical protein
MVLTCYCDGWACFKHASNSVRSVTNLCECEDQNWFQNQALVVFRFDSYPRGYAYPRLNTTVLVPDYKTFVLWRLSDVWRFSNPNCIHRCCARSSNYPSRFVRFSSDLQYKCCYVQGHRTSALERCLAAVHTDRHRIFTWWNYSVILPFTTTATLLAGRFMRRCWCLHMPYCW